MNVLVTGGAGYLGSLVSLTLLKAGCQVRALDVLLYGGRSLLHLAGEPGFEFRRADIRDADAVRSALAGMEAVVHLAAIVGDPACARQPELSVAVNRDAAVELVRAAREAGVRRFVFASTCSNYGRMPDASDPLTEDSGLRPLSLYAETKVAVERELLALPPRPMAATVMRFATLYGLSPRMRFDLTVNEFVMEMLVHGRLEVYGEQFWRPYVHVRDAARAIAMVLETDPSLVAGQVFNVGDTSENFRKKDILDLVRCRAPSAEVRSVARAEDPRDYRVSFERIRERLGYSITRRVADGIGEVASALEAGLIENPRHHSHYNVSP